MSNMSTLSETKYHPDIKFVMDRLSTLLEYEEYEKAVVLKRWIDELIVIHSTK